MTRRLLLLVTALWIAAAAQASYYPRLDTDNIVMVVGQQETVGVQAIWSGFSNWDMFTPWHFTSDDPNVAIVEGGKEQLAEPGAIKITAVAPGIAQVRLGSAGPYATITVAGNYPPPQIALSSRVVARASRSRSRRSSPSPRSTSGTTEPSATAPAPSAPPTPSPTSPRRRPARTTSGSPS